MISFFSSFRPHYDGISANSVNQGHTSVIFQTTAHKKLDRHKKCSFLLKITKSVDRNLENVFISFPRPTILQVFVYL